MSKWECKSCGHIGYPQWVHNDEKCERCYSGQIVELPAEVKQFNVMFNVGKVKYVVNHHDGTKTHPCGSPFFDIAIFKNKKDFNSFQKSLLRNGYVEK